MNVKSEMKIYEVMWEGKAPYEGRRNDHGVNLVYGADFIQAHGDAHAVRVAKAMGERDASLGNPFLVARGSWDSWNVNLLDRACH